MYRASINEIIDEPVERADRTDLLEDSTFSGECGLVISGADFERGITGLGIEELRPKSFLLLAELEKKIFYHCFALSCETNVRFA